MIRRLLCLLLLLVFGVSAAAAEEAYQVQITFEVQPNAGLEKALQDAGLTEPKPETVQAWADFITGLALKFQVQDDGAYLALMHGESSLLDFGVFADDTDGYVTSTFWPNHYLHMPVSPEETAASQEAARLLEEMDWAALANDVWSVLSERTLAMTVEKGHFIGDAYDDGAQRTTLHFSDAELSGAMDAVLSVLDRYGLNDLLLSRLIGEDSLLADLAALNQQIAAENKYSYVLHMVEDKQGAPVGVSLVTTQEDVQVMSLSLGFGDNGYRVVWGYGLNHENIYIDIILIDGEKPNEKEFALTVYKDPTRSGFRAVEPFYDYVQQMYSGTFNLTTGEECTAWKMYVESYGSAASKPDAAWVIDGEMRAQLVQGKQTISIYPSADVQAAPCEVITLTLAACEPSACVLDGYTAIEIDDPEMDELISDLMEEAAANLLVELFRLLPVELLTNLMF